MTHSEQIGAAWQRRRAWLPTAAFGAASVALAVEPAPLVPLAQAVLALCQRLPILSHLTGHAPPLVLAFLLLAATWSGLSAARTAVAGTVATARFTRSLRRWQRPLPVRLAAAARELDLTDSVIFLDLPAPQAYCAGFVRPQVAVSRGLLEILDDGALLAVLAHERQHLQRRDPLRYLIADTLVDAAAMVPLAVALRQRMEARIEIAADRAALRVVPPGALARALLAVVSASAAAPAVPGLAGLSATEARIAQIAGKPALPAIPRWALATSLALAALVIGVATSLAQTAEQITPHCVKCMGL